MNKYDPLYKHLKELEANGRDSWHATFVDIESVLGASLPQSAADYPAWWANEKSDSSHVQKYAWVDAGWRTEDLNLTRRTVVFRKEAA